MWTKLSLFFLNVANTLNLWDTLPWDPQRNEKFKGNSERLRRISVLGLQRRTSTSIYETSLVVPENSHLLQLWFLRWQFVIECYHPQRHPSSDSPFTSLSLSSFVFCVRWCIDTVLQSGTPDTAFFSSRDRLKRIEPTESDRNKASDFWTYPWAAL